MKQSVSSNFNTLSAPLVNPKDNFSFSLGILNLKILPTFVCTWGETHLASDPDMSRLSRVIEQCPEIRREERKIDHVLSRVKRRGIIHLMHPCHPNIVREFFAPRYMFYHSALTRGYFDKTNK